MSKNDEPMTKQEAIQAKQDIEKAFEEISDRMCALQLQYPELGMLAAYQFSQHSFVDNKGCVPADNVTATGSTVFGNLETTFVGMAHILHSIAIDENLPKVAETLIDSLSASWEKMKNDYNIDL
uniref:Uncharacterized protein n=1 Tax=Siphoviridae sp. ctmP19 TaxID=2825651 RepID=A0A8S5PJ31_9CAUD|nr:MAG TPA: hypothetical protein [Siphoviridae sp. ctmP19]